MTISEHEKSNIPGPVVIKCNFAQLTSAKLAMKCKLLLDFKTAELDGVFRFRSTKPVIYPVNKCLNANNYWHLIINEQDKFHGQLSRARKQFLTSGPDIKCVLFRRLILIPHLPKCSLN